LKRLPVFQDPAKLMVTDEDTDTEKADPKQEPVKKKPLKKRSRRGDAPGTPVVDTTSDNSVTHFALLALWTAKHRGVPVDRSLRLLTKRFRTSQSADGSWNYKYQKGGGLPESAPMICAGLLGLALEFGLSDSAESKHALPAPAGAAHLSFAMMGAPSPASFAAAVYTTGQSLAANRAATRRATDRAIVRGIDALTRHVGLPAGRMDNVPQGSLYFLWALERVAVLYDLKTIGGKDWYRWGAEQLVANQKQNGNWDSAYPGTIDTCFALLFLKQANLTSDLTSKLQKDPKAQAKLVKSTAPEPAAPVSPPSALVPVLKPVETPPVQPSPPPNTEAGPPKKDSSKPKAAEPPATKDEESTKSNTWLVAAVGGLAVVLLGCSAVLVLMSRGKAGRAEAGEKRSKRARTERANGKAASSAKTAVKKKGAPNSSAGDEEPDRARAVARKKGKPPMY
jgi:Cu/Ag efflux protein CusF